MTTDFLQEKGLLMAKNKDRSLRQLLQGNAFQKAGAAEGCDH
jgi:hypothetical protein